MKILMVSMSSLHFIRWVDQLKDSGHEVFWFGINDLKILKDVINKLILLSPQQIRVLSMYNRDRYIVKYLLKKNKNIIINNIYYLLKPNYNRLIKKNRIFFNKQIWQDSIIYKIINRISKFIKYKLSY